MIMSTIISRYNMLFKGVDALLAENRHLGVVGAPGAARVPTSVKAKRGMA
jgi:hypothetical protein